MANGKAEPNVYSHVYLGGHADTICKDIIISDCIFMGSSEFADGSGLTKACIEMNEYHEGVNLSNNSIYYNSQGTKFELEKQHVLGLKEKDIFNGVIIINSKNRPTKDNIPLGAIYMEEDTGKMVYYDAVNYKWITLDTVPTSLPASDVYAWAKQPTKPTYTASEVGALASNGTATNASKVEKALTLQIAGTTKNTFNGSSAQTFNIPNASTSTPGVMTKDMVSKLNGIATGATKNTVDTAMSSTSTNAVQNKVIYAYVQEQLNNLANGGISVIKSIQRGVSTIENGDSSCYITINEVNVNKTMVNYLGFSSADSNDTSSDHRYRGYIRLVDSTTIGIRRARSDGDYTYSWEVIEFY